MMKFREWIRQLDVDVIQGEYGYEDGEFSVIPAQWRSLWSEGLSPSAAFRRALDGFAEARREDDRLKQENWERIQQADATARGAAP